MKVKVRYFASLRDKIGRSDEQVSFDGASATVSDLWTKVSNIPASDSILVAVNMEYTNMNHKLKDGDEVAFFPPVTGG
ncbi:MAG: molybdopterin converting factor subunit 1 [Gammaproteobacteria bacterium]|nr:molybdopterin converting factor subunit 1 [Gammaproteobacteria bacterium]